MATTIPHGVPTLQHAIAGLTGYEDTDTLRWQPPGMGAQDRDPGTGPDGLAHGRDLAPTGRAARWPTSEAPASMNVKLKVGNMELMYTARDTNDRDLQDRMTRLLPWLAEVMAACEAHAEARQQTAKPAAAQPTPPPPLAPAPERTLDEQVAATVQAALQAQGAASPNGQSPPRPAPQEPPAREPAAPRAASLPDNDPSWCPRHQVTMTWHNRQRARAWLV